MSRKSAWAYFSTFCSEKIARRKSAPRSTKACARCVAGKIDLSKETKVFVAQQRYAARRSCCTREYCAKDTVRCRRAVQVAGGTCVTMDISCSKDSVFTVCESNDCQRAAVQARARGTRASILCNSRARRRSVNFLYATAEDAPVVFRWPRFTIVQRCRVGKAPRRGWR